MYSILTFLLLFLSPSPSWAQSPTIRTIAGDGNPGFSGDDGIATRSSLHLPNDVAVYNGQIYIADTANHRIRKVDTNTGIMTTIAGVGQSGYWGEGGPATQAAINRPWGICVDANGHLYIADRNNNKIRKVDANTGIISAIAGNGNRGYSGDHGSALQARLNLPSDVFVDTNNHIYIADEFNNRIRKVDANTGIITTIAGNGVEGFSGDNGPATQASLHDPTDIFVDTQGHVYFTARFDHRIRKIDANTGIITTFAGNGDSGFGGDNGPATQATLKFPTGVSGDQNNNIYIADTFNNRIRKIDANTGIITTVVGNGTQGNSGDGGPATEATLWEPSGVFVHHTGQIYIADTPNNRVRVVDTEIPSISVVTSLPNQSLALGGETLIIDIENPTLFSDTAQSPLNYSVTSTNTDVANAEIKGHVLELTATGFGQTHITLTAQNALGASSNISFLVTVDNHAPTAVADTVTISANERININVIQNDWDTEGDAFRVSDVRDGFQSERVIINDDGTIHYRPNTDFVGTDYFTYKIQDQHGGKSQATVWVIVTSELQSGFTLQDSVHFQPTSVGQTAIYTFFVQNPLQTDWTISQITLSGAQSDHFSVEPTTFTLAPNTPEKQITITFAPTFNGTHNATLAIHHTGSESPFQVALRGEGLSTAPTNAGIITTYAGLGRAGFEDQTKLATETFLNQPNWLATDTQGNLYIADSENKRVRKVHIETGLLETIAGNGDTGYLRNLADPLGSLLTHLEGLAVDSQNNIYITSRNWVWRIEAESGLISKYAGAADGGFGYSGDGGAASKAEIREPKGIAVDNQGNLYIADSRNHRIRKVDAQGIITTVAGNGIQGHSGDGGPATQAMLFAPEGVHTDQVGNLYIADWGNNRIRKVDAQTQIITTIAGSGQPGYDGDGGPASQAKLSSPFGIVTDNDENVFFADADHACIRKIDAQTGIISTVIGDGRRGYTGDGGPAHAATLSAPHGLATDAQGNLFIADTENHVIRKVTAFITPPLIVQGIIEDQYLSVGNDPHLIDLNMPSPLFLPADGSLQISAQSADTTIVSVKIEGTVLHIQAKQLGTSNITLTAQNPNGKTTTSTFQAIANNHRPQAINDTIITTPGERVNVYVLHNDHDKDGDVLSVIDASNGQNSERVVINTDGSIHYRPLTPFEGTDQFTYTIQDAHNSQSQGLVVIQYEHNNTPRLRIEGSLTFPSTAVGQVNTATITLKNPGNEPLKIESITITGAHPQDFMINNFTQVIVPANNDPLDLPILFMPQQSNNRTATLSFQVAQQPTTQTTITGTGHHIITKVAGSGRRGFDGDNGPATDAALQFPSDLSVTDNGDIYLIDTRNNRARKIEASTGMITTIAGNGEQKSSGDLDLAILASLSWPEGIAADALGNVYISDTQGNKIRFVDHNTGIISAYAGNGVRGFGGDGASSTSAQLYGPQRIFLAPSGHLYIADHLNDRIRKVDAQTKIITTVAGNGIEGFSGDGGPATQASLAHPTCVWVDKKENIYIADFRNDRIRKVDAQTQTITTVAGTGNQGFSGDGDPATLAMLYYPYTIAVDGAGNIFVSDGGNQRIRRIDGQTHIITTVAGTGVNEASGDNGPAHLAGINHPRAVFLDKGGNLYLSDSDNFIRKIVRIGVPLQSETEIQSSLFTKPDTLQIETNGKTNVSLIENDVSQTTLKMLHVSKGLHSDRVVINSDNTVHYRPQPNFKGIDRFTYIIQNSHGQTAIGHVVVYVGIQPTTPKVLTEIANVEIFQDALPFTHHLQDDPAVFIDEDGDLLSFDVANTDTTIVSTTLSGPTLTIIPHTIGESTITLKATDNSGNQATTQFVVSVIERPSGLIGAPSPEALIHALNTRFKRNDLVSLTGPLNEDKKQDFPLHFISTLPTQVSPDSIQLLRLNTQPIFAHLPKDNLFHTPNLIDQTDSTATYQIDFHMHPDSSTVPITLSLAKKSDHWLINNMPSILDQIMQITHLENYPKILTLISNQQLKKNSPPYTRDLLASPPIFGTPDQRTLTFLASSSDTAAIAGIAQSRLLITPINLGHTEITLSAIDSLGQQATFKFNVEVIPAPKPTPDFNADGQVSFPDFILFAAAFGSTDPNYDLNGDGQVSFPDFIIFGSAFGN